MKVRILTAEKKTYWYAAQIGCIFNVQQSPHDENSWSVSGMEEGHCHYIVKSDCEILPEENQPEPFDLDRALNGDKVITKEGLPVSEIHKFSNGEVYAIIEIDSVKKVFRFSGDGLALQNGLSYHNVHNLFMAPRESEYVTKWVNVYEDNGNIVIGKRPFCSFSIAKDVATFPKESPKYIATTPITFKRPK